jgi:hypothetical protein
MAELSNESQKPEDIGEPYIASSLDSGPLHKKKHEENCVDRIEIEERVDKISLESSPDVEDHREDCCTEVNSASLLEPVQEVNSASPLKPVQKVNSMPSLKPVQEAGFTPPLKPVQEVDSTSTLKPVQEVGSTSTLKPVQEVGSTPSLKPVQEVGSTPPLKPIQEVDCTPPLKPVQEVGSASTVKPVQEGGSAPALTPVQEGGSTPSLKPVQEKDIDDCIYHLKWIMWHDKKTPIVTQNENGPCPLIAISNILLLRGKIILPSVMEIITAKQLMDYIGDMILQNVPKVSITSSDCSVGINDESGALYFNCYGNVLCT